MLSSFLKSAGIFIFPTPIATHVFQDGKTEQISVFNAAKTTVILVLIASILRGCSLFPEHNLLRIVQLGAGSSLLTAQAQRKVMEKSTDGGFRDHLQESELGQPPLCSGTTANQTCSKQYWYDKRGRRLVPVFSGSTDHRLITVLLPHRRLDLYYLKKLCAGTDFSKSRHFCKALWDSEPKPGSFVATTSGFFLFLG